MCTRCTRVGMESIRIGTGAEERTQQNQKTWAYIEMEIGRVSGPSERKAAVF